ncbi:hypothetical protein [Winogradskyella sp. PG-2]|uniref:hypothetical protein n=1 Tax=Winogradskyella sp. PG-2 TaxID=754409 RepID=UPI0004587E70|nr:hypothetical protein [Winogradskyella sp. PG-2]BAO75422.1 hypothetical protein WPG_1192 [Winogradskyella sp. PG-2]
MKILLSLFTLILFTESCNSTKAASTDSRESYTDSTANILEITDKNATLNKFKDGIFLIYKALSRGTFIFVEISETEVLVSSDRNFINKDKYSCEKGDWEELNKLLEKVNRETFTELEAPTNQRLFDGAAHATLTIKEGGEEITTSSFDHGSPPEVIMDLVNKVLSIKENVIKQ